MSIMHACDECGAENATVHLTYISGDTTTVSYLCAECARKKGISVSLIDEKKADETGMPDNNPDDQSICPSCGTKFVDFREKGLLGCSECYMHFEKEIDSILGKTNDTLIHRGKQYAVPGLPPCGKDVDLDRLRNELLKAISREEFELAASIRDEIRSISGIKKSGGENGDKA
jgi:protein arginine kinase activator